MCLQSSLALLLSSLSRWSSSSSEQQWWKKASQNTHNNIILSTLLILSEKRQERMDDKSKWANPLFSPLSNFPHTSTWAERDLSFFSLICVYGEMTSLLTCFTLYFTYFYSTSSKPNHFHSSYLSVPLFPTKLISNFIHFCFPSWWCGGDGFWLWTFTGLSPHTVYIAIFIKP